MVDRASGQVVITILFPESMDFSAVNKALRVEGAPFTHDLSGQILLIMLQSATCYAQSIGREQVWLMQPAEGLISLYTDTYGFALAKTQQGVPYCYREVP